MKLTSTHFRGMILRVECEYEPGSVGDRYEPPSEEQMDIGGIFADDGVTPIALTDRQVEELETQLLAEYHGQTVTQPATCKIERAVSLALRSMSRPNDSLLGYIAADALHELAEKYTTL